MGIPSTFLWNGWLNTILVLVHLQAQLQAQLEVEVCSLLFLLRHILHPHTSWKETTIQWIASLSEKNTILGIVLGREGFSYILWFYGISQFLHTTVLNWSLIWGKDRKSLNSFLGMDESWSWNVVTHKENETAAFRWIREYTELYKMQQKDGSLLGRNTKKTAIP